MPSLELLDRQEEDWALLRKESGGTGRSIAIFVHGFLGDHLTTWGRLPEMLLEHAQADTALAGWDFLFLGYPTRKVTTYLDITRLIATQLERALNCRLPFDIPYSRLAFFGLGTKETG